MPSKPKRISVVRDGEIVVGPLVGSDSIFAGAKDDVTVRLDRRSLRPIWKVESNGLSLGQLISDDFISVGGKTGAGVRSTADGRLLWSAPTRFLGAIHWRDFVVLDGENLELRDQHTGDLIRAISIPGGLERPGTPCGTLWVLPTGTPRVKAMNLESGVIGWERELLSEMAPYLRESEEHGAIGITPASVDGIFIACHGDSMFGCSLEDGSIVWHAPVAFTYPWPSVEAGRVYVLHFERFTAVDETTGQVLYEVKHPELRRAYRAKSGTVYKGRIAIPNESGHLAVFNLEDGALVALHEDKLPLWRTAEADGRLLVTTGDGKLLVFDESIWGL